MPAALFNKRTVLIIAVALILLVEAVWAIGRLARIKGDSASSAGGAVSKTSQAAPSATLSLQSAKATLKVGEKTTISIVVASADTTDGTDVILTYDPKLLTVIPAGDKNPVQTSTLYSNYPINSLDQVVGRITISGIVGPGKGVVPSGILGTFTVQANAPGQTKIAFDFTPGKTTDSNVIKSEAAKDILTSAQNLDLTITP